MTTLRLQNVSTSSYRIVQGRNKVGFVNKCPTGWVARIGTHCEVRETPQAAFEAVGVKALGYRTKGELNQHNAEVRQHNRAVRAESDRQFAEYLGPELTGMLNSLIGRRR